MKLKKRGQKGIKKPITMANKQIKKKESREIIMKYHTLQKQLDQALDDKEKQKIQSQLEELGGIRVYQDASVDGHTRRSSHFNAAKWVVDRLKAHQLLSKEKKLNLLDVGSLCNHFSNFPNDFTVFAIDLEPRHPSVQKADFFDLNLENDSFDVIVLSLVVNFVGTKEKRGEMLKRSAAALCEGGHLFSIMPRPCFENSRYITNDLFIQLCVSLDLFLLEQKHTTKLSFHVFEKSVKREHSSLTRSTKIMRSGGNRNNFNIVL
eukprot:GCRY01003539.1.p1 GENE.GCRY01003539.1~~GCRY01003539.1.p1  ORF type:complete len:263 (+),score=28.81 GCRY01003539.1:129-917(+)